MNILRGLIRLKERLKLIAYRRRLAARVEITDSTHRSYLDVQLERTLSKRRVALPGRALELMDHVKKHVVIGGRDVLCVGCRDMFEVDFFRREGAAHTVGIDLYSESSDICIMDMHNMDFEDGSFDLIYSSHSLEHALDVRKVIEEFIRVVRSGGIIVIEVPANYETRGADIVDFGTIDNLHDCFSGHLDKVVWSETVTDECGKTRALRTILNIVKNEYAPRSVPLGSC